ncbi:Crp/Fnr family transcriptional regulator [Lachnoclostridium sp. An181]|uniref:Crp/Fnr family transcriptional regulator n=1 Tax=Lachnoclostridium sp. An181 TaxID=1965575 RepID=UPI000B3710FD|nr:Crp/Fnr family transcriptional regulator [Lachnoclostridium sp. An181]OUP49296.1 Crp/Fnr family transcriptional regulator [Lachnoclostridium sp. An181]
MKLGEYFPFWRQLKEEEQKELEHSLYTRMIKKGEHIFTGKDCLGLLAVVSGMLRGYIISEEGKEMTLYRLIERDVCLFAATCMMPNIDFEIHIVAKEDTKVVVLPTSVFKKMAKTSLPVANYTNELMASHFSDVMWLMDQVMNKSMDSRIAAFLVEEASLLDSRVLKVTHEQIAKELGTAREVVTRMLKHLQSERMIALSRGAVKITDEKALRELAADSIR